MAWGSSGKGGQGTATAAAPGPRRPDDPSRPDDPLHLFGRDAEASRNDGDDGHQGSSTAITAPIRVLRPLPWGGAVQASALWGASRIALIGFVLLLSWVEELDPSRRARDWLQWAIDRFWGRDAGHFTRVADVGYPKGSCCDQAYLPGYPLAIRAMSWLIGGDLRLAALLVTAVAGLFASGLLYLLTADRVGARDPQDARPSGLRAVTYLIVAPYGIFLTVGYAEALFLALAIGAWLAGTRRHWWLAGLLMAGAAGIRINGLFLVAALGLMYLLQLRADRRRPRADILAFALPVLVLGGIGFWLYRSTGSWNAWQQAEVKGWNRHSALPWQGLADGWNEISTTHGPHILIAGLAAFATVVVGLLLVLVFAGLRRWPEMLFMLLNVLVLVCSTTFVSAPRYGLAWFPAFVLAAELTGRRGWRWLHPVLVIACLPLLAALALLYARQAWVS